jgi:glycine/D-amino acid oxidase-like deaminating enzyme
MNNLLAHVGLQLPLEPVGVQLVYFQPDDLAAYSSENMPVFITHLRGNKSDWVYGIPSLNGSGLKVAFHDGVHVKDVADMDYTPKDEIVERVRQFNRRYIPGADVPAKATRICLYTMTPDENFVIDHHPEHKHIVIASPCSGHGFKFTTLIGKMLTELAFDGTTHYGTSLFGINRFL